MHIFLQMNKNIKKRILKANKKDEDLNQDLIAYPNAELKTDDINKSNTPSNIGGPQGKLKT